MFVSVRRHVRARAQGTKCEKSPTNYKENSTHIEKNTTHDEKNTTQDGKSPKPCERGLPTMKKALHITPSTRQSQCH